MGKIKNLLIIPFIFLFILTAGCSKVNQENVNPKPIKISLDVFPGYAYIFIAKEKGIFKKNGVEVEIVLNQDYLVSQQNFSNGLVDGVFSVYADAISASDQAVPLKIVCVRDQSIKGDVIVARPEITSLEDLKGKKIGVEGINSFSHLFVLNILKKHGINEGDVFFANIGAQHLVEAMERGEVAAGHTYGAGVTHAKEKGYHPLAYAGEVQGIITDVLVFNPTVIKNRPEDIKKIVKSLFEALEFQKTNREEALQIMAKALGDTPQSVGEGIDGLKNFDLKESAEAMRPSEELTNLFGSGKIILEFFINRGQISTSPDLNQIIDNSFVEQLSREQK